MSDEPVSVVPMAPFPLFPSWPGLPRPTTRSPCVAEGVDARLKAGDDDAGSDGMPDAPLLPDPSFRRLLGEPQWRSLVPAVRARFAWKPAAGAGLRYVGAMEVVRSSRAGWLLAQLFRLIGTPLAPHRGTQVPVTVTLRLAEDGKGVVWHRLYRFPGRAPVACVSVKEASERHGLVERVGAGIGMWLRLSAREGALHFESTGYFWRLGRFHLRLPDWLTPGVLHVAHIDEGGGRFRFRIAVEHPRFGEVFFQDGVFCLYPEETPWTASSSS